MPWLYGTLSILFFYAATLLNKIGRYDEVKILFFSVPGFFCMLIAILMLNLCKSSIHNNRMREQNKRDDEASEILESVRKEKHLTKCRGPVGKDE